MPASICASVVFLRIQDFARRAASEQTRMRAQLEAVVAVTVAELDPAGRVVLEAADGAVIVVLRDAKGALRLAVLALALVGGGVTARASSDGKTSFADVLAKVPSWRTLVQKVSF